VLQHYPVSEHVEDRCRPFTGKPPERTDPASQDHMTILQGIATEGRLLLGRQG
jgi:hypothetical protein